jgi:hypothetical protein
MPRKKGFAKGCGKRTLRELRVRARRLSMLRGREIAGFALAPLPVLAPLLLICAAILTETPSDSADIVQVMLELVLMSYGATLLVGVPVHALLLWKQRKSLRAYSGLSAASVLVVGGTLVIVRELFPPHQINPFEITVGGRLAATAALAVVAALTAAVFWKVAVRPRQ